MPFNPPHMLNTHHNEWFSDKKGTDNVGALTKDGYSPDQRRAKPVGQVEQAAEIPVKFTAVT